MRSSLRRRLAPLLVVVVAAACSEEATDRPAPVRLPSVVPGGSPAPAALADVAGRLLVVGIDDELVLIDADGSDATLVAPADGEIEERTMPTWSPDGGSFAWIERTSAGGVELVTASRAGDELSRIDVPIVVQYMAWSPDADSIAVMGNDAQGELVLAIATPGDSVELFDAGAPMYLDWTPDGSGLLVHVADRFELAPIVGPREPIETDGDFRVGVHVGDDILYGVDAAVGEVLVVRTDPDERPRGLLRYAAPAALVVAPSLDRIAILARGSSESAAVIEFDDPLLSTLAPSRLEIMDLDSGDLTTVLEEPAVAWFWSPNAERLLYSTPIVEDGETRVKWWVFENGSSTEFEGFVPTGRFARGYLAFFDQFDRSVSFWSPDSAAYVYAGGQPAGELDPALRAGIWVQLVGDFPPTLVAEGQVAVWSPN